MPSCSPQLYRSMLAKRSTVLQQPLNTLPSNHLARPHTVPLPTRCLPTNASTSRQPGSLSSFRRSNTFCIPNRSRQPLSLQQTRCASSSSKWISRQSSDHFSREAKLQNLKSRAAFKLLQINERYHLFRPGMTVVDLGYAPGSWSQVAIDLVRPGLGRVVGVDVIPIQPPKGVNGIQGDFLSPEVQARVRDFLRDESRGKMRRSPFEDPQGEVVQAEQPGYLDMERAATSDAESSEGEGQDAEHEGKCVDMVLSDMMMNTTGNKFRDHAGSMDLCRSALYFSYETLKIGGHFVCKFYQGAEDKQFEKQLKAMFHKVHREKPESSRSESRETFFVALKRLAKVDKQNVFDEG